MSRKNKDGSKAKRSVSKRNYSAPGSVAKKLGKGPRLNVLTKKNCLEMASLLRKKIEKGVYKGDLLKKAKRQAYWYQHHAETHKFGK